MTRISAAEYRQTVSKQADFIKITLTDMPPSTNGLRKSFIKGGKVHSVKSDQYAGWLSAALWEIAVQRPGKIEGPYTLSIAAQRNWRSKRARDIDNIIKPVSDSLVKAGVVVDDSLAESVSAKWADDLGGKAVVIIVQKANEALAA
jgi:Holliday junction resolvase RusA-like endonuclease